MRRIVPLTVPDVVPLPVMVMVTYRIVPLTVTCIVPLPVMDISRPLPVTHSIARSLCTKQPFKHRALFQKRPNDMVPLTVICIVPLPIIVIRLVPLTVTCIVPLTVTGIMMRFDMTPFAMGWQQRGATRNC